MNDETNLLDKAHPEHSRICGKLSYAFILTSILLSNPWPNLSKVVYGIFLSFGEFGKLHPTENERTYMLPRSWKQYHHIGQQNELDSY